MQNNDVAKKKYNAIERGALIRGIKFDLKLSEYMQYYGKPCHYCGTPAIGLDRIDSVLHYTQGNVVACCTTCNMMKSTLESDAFVLHCKRIALHNDNETRSQGMIPLNLMNDESERQYIAEKLKETNGSRTETAKILGISTTTLWRKINKHNIVESLQVN